jgi:polyphenol oxidase
MIRKERNGIQWLEFDLLSNIPCLKHGVFLRDGGKSKGPYASLNLSYNVGDNTDNVNENQKTAADSMGLRYISWSNQNHGTEINEISIETPAPTEGDALATDFCGVGIMITHADCQAALFYDPEHRIIANAHAGWRGSVQNIYAHTVEFLGRKYASKPENLLVCISPSLGPQSAEFVNYRQELPENFWEFQVKPNYFDFWAISKMQLTQCGVLPEHIEVAEIDTYTNPKDFFSYRREKITGRNATVIMLE